MILPLVLVAGLLAPQSVEAPTLRLLFLGNSHTQLNALPAMVKSLLEADGSKRKVEVKMEFGPRLNDLGKSPAIQKMVKDPRWDVVVLQGAMLSQSHKYQYSQAEGVELAKMAEKAGNRTIYFAEWPRKGWNESDYIMGIYKAMADSSGAEIAPVCRVWDAVLKSQPKLEPWESDGNHAKAPGTYIAAVTIYRKILGPEKAKEPKWVPHGVDAKLAPVVLEAAKSVVK